MKRSWFPKKEPHLPPDHDNDVVMAVRAVFKGEADQGQQIIFRDYLMYVTGASEEFADLSYRPGDGGKDATNFAEGKRFVGLMLRKLLRPEFDPKDKKELVGDSQLMRRAKAQLKQGS